MAEPLREPPAENGLRLETFPRGDGVELRLTLAEYKGKPYFALRVWERDRSGQWWPLKGKGCSIRLTEAAALAEALARSVSRACRCGDHA